MVVCDLLWSVRSCSKTYLVSYVGVGLEMIFPPIQLATLMEVNLTKYRVIVEDGVWLAYQACISSASSLLADEILGCPMFL